MLITTWNKSSATAAVLLADQSFLASPTLLVPLGLILMLCLWHLWKFKICHHFYPDSPKELPYWTPCMCAGWYTTLVLG